MGPFAVVDLETTGLSLDQGAELLEVGAVLVDPGAAEVETLASLVRPAAPLPPAIARLTGLSDAEVGVAPELVAIRAELAEALRGRTLVAHNADFERAFLVGAVDPAFARAPFLDTLDLLALTHPDAPDLRLESFTRMLLGTEEHHRALEDALDTARVISRAGRGAAEGEPRFAVARRALESFAPASAWLGLLAKPRLAERLRFPEAPAHVRVGETEEPPVPFDEDAIASVLADEARGRRHFPGYRAREAQIRLARAFARNLEREEVLLLEGGTGVGKSLAYLAAAIPFAVERDLAGEPTPVVISTRTKLLQDQLVGRDIAAAARFLGYPELRAVSIKGRGNYACARRLQATLAEGSEQSIFPEDRMAYAVLHACARTRPYGEIGAVPGALLRRYPALRDLLRRSVAARAELCTREQCAKHRDCALGRRRAALADAHLIVANHDLLLRWPPDYPAFHHAIVDEVHELADVADEVYALEVRPDVVLERLDDLFGRPAGRGRRGGSEGLLPAAERRRLAADAKAWRRGLALDLSDLGRALADEASDWGEVQVPEEGGGARFRRAARLASTAAERLEQVADRLPPDETAGGPVDRARDDLVHAAEGLRLAFEESSPDAVAAFEGVVPPFDRWRLAVRPVAPGLAFHEGFMEKLRSFAGVSASLFVQGDAFASLGDLEIEERAGERLVRDGVPSPFPYASHMRVAAMRGGRDLVAETTAVLDVVARELGGRTLGLFTSLRRLNEVGDQLDARLRDEGIEILSPRRASDDPVALVARFMQGGAVLLGARRFWQGVDIPGDALQAVVIEKLPFEVPTELRRRRDRRLQERGVDAFGRSTMGRMLLNLKQMAGRLVRSEDDRGLVVIVEGRSDKRYFRRLAEALPEGSGVEVVQLAELPRVLAEVGLGSASGAQP